MAKKRSDTNSDADKALSRSSTPGTDVDEKSPLLGRQKQNEENPGITSQKDNQAIPSAPDTYEADRRSSHVVHIFIAACLLGIIFLVHFFAEEFYSYGVCTQRGEGIYTVDPLRPRVQCIVIGKDGRIIDRGSPAEIKQRHQRLLIRPTPRGAIVVPGLSDSHVHLLEYGWAKNLDLTGCQSISEVVQRIRDYILSKSDLQEDRTAWIEGAGWDQSLWEGGHFPTAADLDADPVLRGRPIMLYRKDFHVAWVSPTVLNLSGTLPDTVEGGKIIRDSQGQATGIFLDKAILVIPVPPWSETRMREYFAKATKDALSVGLTAVHDAKTLENVIEFYKKLADEGALPIRLYLMANRDVGGYWGKDVEKLVDYADGRLNVRSIKLIADGALGSWGAKMYRPYDDNDSSSGFWRVSLETLKSDIPRYIEDGWQVNVHCIGDRANGEVLDIFEQALKGKNTTELRPRIEHAQVVRLDDLKRFGELGIIASVQPTHATSDMLYSDGRLGDRAKGACAFRSMLNGGARLTLGTDFPVETNNPLATFYAAVTRLSPEGTSPHGKDGWYEEQKLTREEALKGMTLDPAFASFSEADLGSLEIGKRADFVVLSQDIMTIPVSDILNTRVVATVLDGKVAFGQFV